MSQTNMKIQKVEVIDSLFYTVAYQILAFQVRLFQYKRNVGAFKSSRGPLSGTRISHQAKQCQWSLIFYLLIFSDSP